jgi:hypothetical protein
MYRIDEAELLKGEQAGRHTWPDREDDKGQAVAEHKSPSDALKNGRWEGIVRVCKESYCGWDVDHSVRLNEGHQS